MLIICIIRRNIKVITTVYINNKNQIIKSKISIMTTFNEKEILSNMQQIIDKSRCGIDGFFTDSRSAAKDILKYLETENLIKSEATVEINYNEHSQAA